MKMTITARNMTVSPSVTARIEKKAAKMGRYLLPETEMQVRMRKEKNGLRVVEITVPMGNGVILRAEASAEDIRAYDLFLQGNRLSDAFTPEAQARAQAFCAP